MILAEKTYPLFKKGFNSFLSSRHHIRNNYAETISVSNIKKDDGYVIYRMTDQNIDYYVPYFYIMFELKIKNDDFDIKNRSTKAFKNIKYEINRLIKNYLYLTNYSWEYRHFIECNTPYILNRDGKNFILIELSYAEINFDSFTKLSPSKDKNNISLEEHIGFTFLNPTINSCKNIMKRYFELN